MMRPLIIDSAIKAKAANVVRYAALHPYLIPNAGGQVPGDNPRHVLKPGFGYRCVFSYTRTPTATYRDLSVSVSARGKFPNPFALYTIATDLFGFTGWDGRSLEPPQDWLLVKDLDWDAIRVAQEIR
jgi:hypothetical protein